MRGDELSSSSSSSGGGGRPRATVVITHPVVSPLFTSVRDFVDGAVVREVMAAIKPTTTRPIVRRLRTVSAKPIVYGQYLRLTDS